MYVKTNSDKNIESGAMLQDLVDRGYGTLRKEGKHEVFRLRRFLQKNFPYHAVETGRIRISHLGNSGWRSSRLSTARMAFLPSAMPRCYFLRLSSTTGGLPFPVLLLAHASIGSTASNFVPFPCSAKIPQHRSSGV
jgi:hypothetical protein